ncbi:MAG: MaoC family dehydratase [Candidatus Helarchaeota archaeon]
MELYEQVKEGEELPPFSIKIDAAMYKKYNRLIHEINPLHFNEKYAQSLGYKTIVVAGVFTASFFLRAILDWSKNPSNIVGYTIQFLNPVYLGDTITHRTIVKKKYEDQQNRWIECDVKVENQVGQEVTRGRVTLRFIA